MKKLPMMAMAAVCGMVACAAPHPQPAAGGARAEFMKQQMYDELQRIASEMSVLEASQADLMEKMRRLEHGNRGDDHLKDEIAALRSDMTRLRNEMNQMRGQIVEDLLRRIDQKEASRPKPPPPDNTPRGTYQVRPGDTLSLIAQAFGTSVSKLKEMNKLTDTRLRVGQKLIVPDPNAKKR